MNPNNIGSYICGAVALDPAVITAAAGNDGQEVSGPAIARDDFPYARSAKLVIQYKAVLDEDETLSIAANLQDADASSFGGGDAADFGDAFASAVVATGGAGGSTERGTVEIPVDLRKARAYLRAQVTADLSRGGTDTVAIAAALVLGGFDVLPIVSDLVHEPS